MNNGGYSSQDPATLGAKVEEVVRADLESASPIPFEIDGVEGKTVSPGSFLSDAAIHLFGGKETVLTTVAFNLAAPRPTELRVRLNRQGVGSHLGSAFYSTKLSKPVAGEVSLEDPKMFGNSKFTGDAAACAKLNANKDLIKRVNKFSRTECKNFHLTAPRLFQIKPEGAAAILVAASLPRSYAMGLKVSLDVKEFMDLAELIEATL